MLSTHAECLWKTGIRYLTLFRVIVFPYGLHYRKDGTGPFGKQQEILCDLSTSSPEELLQSCSATLAMTRSVDLLPQAQNPPTAIQSLHSIH
jgi:hypothetical protein